jgi:hypothetical protein
MNLRSASRTASTVLHAILSTAKREGWLYPALALSLVFGASISMPSAEAAEGGWRALLHQPPGFLDDCHLLTDGTVVCHEFDTNRWHSLTPTNTGSYLKGTWDARPIPPMPDGVDLRYGCNPCTYAPIYFASAVLPDGRMIVIGGEYNADFGAVWTNVGFLYDPVSNSWSEQVTEAFGGGRIGDAMGIVLADGTFILSDILSGNVEAFDPDTLSFTPLNPPGKRDINNEEGWNMLPDGTVLTVDTRLVSSYEIYDPIANSWGHGGSTVVNLADCCGPPYGNSKEVGPGVLLPNGKLVYFSGNSTGQNAVYDPDAGSWSHTAAFDFPLVPGQTYHFAMADGPAAALPNGHVLVMASPVSNNNPFNTPSHFWEFTGTALKKVVDSPHAPQFPSYDGRMLVLPDGKVLLTAYDQLATQDVALYTNGGAPKDSWRPAITTVPNQLDRGATYSISGTLFNGFTEGASYGDDSQTATNYPLVRITNKASGHVAYARTHDHSRMGVERVGSTEIVSTQFDVPNGIETGPSNLVVVANGIASQPKQVSIN